MLAESWFGVRGGGRPPAGRPLLSLVPCVAGSEPFGPHGSYSKNTVYAVRSHTRLQGTGSGVLAKGVLAGLESHRVGRGGVCSRVQGWVEIGSVWTPQTRAQTPAPPWHAVEHFVPHVALGGFGIGGPM